MKWILLIWTKNKEDYLKHKVEAGEMRRQFSRELAYFDRDYGPDLKSSAM
jgi:hypothetical protein